MSTETIPRMSRRRAWRLLLGILAVGVLSAGGVYLWQWLHRPPALRVVGRWAFAGNVAAVDGGFALQTYSVSDQVGPVAFHDWSGAKVWDIDGDDLSGTGIESLDDAVAPGGHWYARALHRFNEDMVLAWHDGVMLCAKRVPHCACRHLQVTDDGTAWFTTYADDTLTVTAVRAGGTLVGRANLPAPFPRSDDRGRSPRSVREAEAERAAMGMGPRYRLWAAHVAPDGRTLRIEAEDWYGISCWRVYPNYRTYRIQALPDRLALERTAVDTRTVREMQAKEADETSLGTVTAPGGATWAVPAPLSDRQAQTADGRFAMVCRKVTTPQHPLMIGVRAKWAALRRAPAPSTDPDRALVVSVYERPGVLRGTATLPMGPAQYMSVGNLGIAPDGHGVLVQAEGAVYLLRW